jgi:RimJ/RimL family protein N-acetyltransferase
VTTDDGVVLRSCRADDAAGLVEMYRRDPDQGEVTEEGQLDRITRLWTEYRTLGFVAVEETRIVALFLLEDITDGCAIVGYYVSPDRRRRGVATRGLGWLIERAFTDLALQTLVVDILPDNDASVAVAERSGFAHAGLVTLDGVEYRRLVLGRCSAS